MEQKEILARLIQEKRFLDLFIIARLFYRFDEPLLEDSKYEQVENFCRDLNLGSEYMIRTYDDDPLPHHLIEEFELSSMVPDFVSEQEEHYEDMDADKSLSIRAVTTPIQAWEFAKSIRGQRSVMSLKGNGVYSKAKYVDKKLVIGLSRGRIGNAWKMTSAMSLVYPTKLEDDSLNNIIKIYSEALVPTEHLEYFKHKYDMTKFKTEKSAAISLLRKVRDPEDYDKVKFYTFSADGLTGTISGDLAKCKELGFEVVPHLIIEPNEIPETFEEFELWVADKMEVIWKQGIDIASDGMVWEIDDLAASSVEVGQYSSRNIAIKYGPWSYQYYPGKVVKIIADETLQERVDRSCKVLIEPLLTRDNTTATAIHSYNPAILVETGIRVGSPVFFERNSGAVNVLVRGSKLQSLEQYLVEEEDT
jgi:NAD-dependent DNA ligase